MKLTNDHSQVVTPMRTAAPRGVKREHKAIQRRYTELAHEELDHVEILDQLQSDYQGHSRDELEEIVFSGEDHSSEPSIPDKAVVWPPRSK